MSYRIPSPTNRETENPVLRLLADRWSPRAMSGEPLSAQEVATLFDAARFAPSANNEQPWRFLYALRDTPAWSRFFGLLAEGNQLWCAQAGMLVVVLSKTVNSRGRFDRTHSFCTGSAWQNLALQGWSLGLVVHGMGGFDYDRAKAELGVPEPYAVEAMIAIGRPGPPETLPPHLQEREKPSDRRPWTESAFEGGFPGEG
ncbi:MAG TPA: nitroreductase family protein [Thermoanaerobaculia bacterium]|nr:nitroreductase family protein [Thermoanaerobaculia bacterium]